jgi:hypothetical protein
MTSIASGQIKEFMLVGGYPMLNLGKAFEEYELTYGGISAGYDIRNPQWDGFKDQIFYWAEGTSVFDVF